MNITEVVAVRKANGIKQFEFADLIGVPVGTWSNVEAGRQRFYKNIRAKAVNVLQEMNCDFSILEDKEAMDKLPKYVGRISRVKEEYTQKSAVKIGESYLVETPFVTGNMPDETATVPNFEEELTTLPSERYLMTKDELFHQIATEVADILSRKNHDYGDSFHNVYKEFGDLSTYMRISDKMGRMQTVVKGIELQVKEEQMEDILRDIAGYCILTLSSKERLKQQGE